MFDRGTLKQRGMFAFKRNYWWCVLAAIIISFAIGGGSGGSGGSSARNTNSGYSSSSGNDYQDILNDLPSYSDNSSAYNSLFAGLAGVIVVIVVLAMLISIAFKVFLGNPLLVGGRRFFTVNSFEKANFNEIGFAFKKGRYMNIVKVMFMKDLFIFLWSLLCVIPGIIKSYEYYLVEYILTEDPNIDYDTALRKSREMMNGYKLDTFVLQLSFIGWQLLSVLTCGILSVFYVNPYMYATQAELFLHIRGVSFGVNVAPYYTPAVTGAYGIPQQFTAQTQQYGTQQYNPQPQQYNPQPVQPQPQQYEPIIPDQPVVETKIQFPSQQSAETQVDPYAQPIAPEADPYAQPTQVDPYAQPINSDGYYTDNNNDPSNQGPYGI